MPSGAPLNLVLDTMDSRTLVGSWNPPSPEHQNGEILYYTVNLTLTAEGEMQVMNGELQMFNASSPSLFIASLHPDYTYSFSVAAVNSVGTGPSRTTTIKMPEAGEK